MSFISVVLEEKSVAINHQPESTVPKTVRCKKPVLRYLSQQKVSKKEFEETLNILEVIFF